MWENFRDGESTIYGNDSSMKERLQIEKTQLWDKGMSMILSIHEQNTTVWLKHTINILQVSVIFFVVD